MMTTRNKALTGVATATLLLTQALALPALGASAARLTKARATEYARKDATAAAAVFNGDKVKVSGCHAIRGGAYRCSIELIPVRSGSRCRWNDTVRLVKGKPVVSDYSRVTCSN